MNIKKEFIYNPNIEVSASQIGISKWNWVSIKSMNQIEAQEIMKINRFDVLPIENEDGSVSSFFSTQEWNNYDYLNKLNIKNTQMIYYRLSLKDLIRKFKNENSYYYFLTDYENILGLVSFINLNCQLVYNYLYFVISDIERSISDKLKESISQEKILNKFKESEDNHLKEVAKSFQNNINNNYDNNIFHHMYLQTIGITLKKFQDELPPKIKKLNKYSAKFSPQGIYNLLRQRIMHSVRPILSDKESINQIDELLSDFVEIKNIIES